MRRQIRRERHAANADQGRGGDRRCAPAQASQRGHRAPALLERLQQPGQREPAGARDDQAGQDRSLGPELKGCRSEQQDRKQGHDDTEHESRRLAVGDGARVRDHEQGEDQHLGRGDQDLPQVTTAQGGHMPAGHHAVVWHGRERQGDEGGEPEHVAELEAEQLELPADEDAADDEDRVREVHPGPERDPPEILGLGELWPERDERDHQAEVGRVEDVPALPPDQVLRSHREGDHAQEDPDSVQAPPVAVQRAGHAEDEGGAVARKKARGRPQDDPVLEEADDELDQRPGCQADQDLGD